MTREEEILFGIMGEEKAKRVKKKIMRKKGKKDVVVNKDKKEKCLQLDNNFAQIVDFTQIKGKVEYKRKEDVFDWGVLDMAYYIGDLFYKKYNKSWGHRNRGACPEISRIHDKILDILGFCDNLALRDYINYIFENHIDSLIKKANGVFYLRNFRNDSLILSFCHNYNYKYSYEKEMKKKKNKNNQIINSKIDKKINSDDIFQSISSESILKSYLLSEEDFVYEYGIIISIYWLIMVQDFSKKEATKKVYNICKKIFQKKRFELVKKITEDYSPYPTCLIFPKLDNFVKSIDKEIKIEIEYKKDDYIKNKFCFIKEKNE